VRVGDIVVKRSIYRGNVRWALPHRFVGTWGDCIAIYCGPGDAGKATLRGTDGYLKRWMSDAPPRSYTWERGAVLRFERPGAAHNIEVLWDLDWVLHGWYVNLQSPIAVHGRFIDTADQALDVLVSADGSWEWKDEDELAEGVDLGIWTEAEAAEIRAEGERVIAAAPWPTGWEDWRPPREWGPLGLPRDWHVV
jgi:hypothetical protein